MQVIDNAAESAAIKALVGGEADRESWEYFMDVILPLEPVWEAKVPRTELLAPHIPHFRERCASYAEGMGGHGKAWVDDVDLAEFTRVARKLPHTLAPQRDEEDSRQHDDGGNSQQPQWGWQRLATFVA